MLKSLFTALSLLILAGCAAATKTYLPTGESGFNVDCSGPYLNWGKCYEKAGGVCGANGYQVLAKEGDAGQSLAGNAQGVYADTNITRTLLISCGKND